MDDVQAHLDSVAAPRRRRDAHTLLEMMRRITGAEPRLWGTVVGFGQYHYHYASGRQGDAAAAGFAPRKAASTIYLMDGVEAHADQLERLGPHTTGIGCLYLKDLDDVDLGVLEQIVTRSFATLTAGTWPSRARDGH